MTATNHRNQSSNFAPGHQIGYFPGVAASWRLSVESFMRRASNLFKNIKILLGCGSTGNSNTNGQNHYGSAINPVVTGLGTGFSLANFSNPNLTWETAIQSNGGIDFSILHNRVDATFDVYKKLQKFFVPTTFACILRWGYS
ncbi:hypothetical protein [Hydrotalea sp.]|uniref:hypothetical protein n=1 Tax=Hydrotalea sp. TaxID=2881279 RepID=UPI003D0E4C29